MLTTATYWMAVASTVGDVLLLVRILTLKLHRAYVFVTLYCVLAILFDAVGFSLGLNSPEFGRAVGLSRFLYAGLIPLVVWDLLEELTTRSELARRISAAGFKASLLVGILFSAFLGIGIFSLDIPDGASVTELVGLLIWGVCCSVMLSFLWKTLPMVAKQGIAIPRNTRSWSLFFQLTWGSEVVVIMVATIVSVNNDQSDMVDIGLMAFGLACTIWCIARLRPIAKDDEATSAPAVIG